MGQAPGGAGGGFAATPLQHPCSSRGVPVGHCRTHSACASGGAVRSAAAPTLAMMPTTTPASRQPTLPMLQQAITARRQLPTRRERVLDARSSSCESTVGAALASRGARRRAGARRGVARIPARRGGPRRRGRRGMSHPRKDVSHVVTFIKVAVAIKCYLGIACAQRISAHATPKGGSHARVRHGGAPWTRFRGHS
jgi:hypothetical protein